MLTRVVALACLVVLACAPAASSLSEHGVGEVVELSRGEHVWRAPPGDYWFQFVSPREDGLVYEFDTNGSATVPAPACAAPPQESSDARDGPATSCAEGPPRHTGASGTLIEIEEDSPLRFRVLNGTGKALLALPTLMNKTVEDGGTHGRVVANGTLSQGCTAITVIDSPFHTGPNPSWLRGPLLVKAAAPEMELRFFDTGLLEVASARDVLVHTLEVEQGDYAGFVQICGDTSAPRAYAVHVERHDAPEPIQTRTVPFQNVVGATVALAAAMVVWRRLA